MKSKANTLALVKRFGTQWRKHRRWGLMEVNPLTNVWLYRPFHLLSASECKHLRTGRTEVKGSWMGGLCHG